MWGLYIVSGVGSSFDCCHIFLSYELASVQNLIQFYWQHYLVWRGIASRVVGLNLFLVSGTLSTLAEWQTCIKLKFTGQPYLV